MQEMSSSAQELAQMAVDLRELGEGLKLGEKGRLNFIQRKG